MWMFSQVTLLMTSVPSHAMYLGQWPNGLQGWMGRWGANPHEAAMQPTIQTMELSLAVSNKLAMLKWRFQWCILYIFYMFIIYIYIHNKSKYTLQYTRKWTPYNISIQ